MPTTTEPGLTLPKLAVKGLRAHLRRAVAAALAVVAGVSFLTATLVLSDSMRAGFSDSFVAANEDTAVVVRNSTRLGNDEMAVDIGTVPASLLDQLVAVPGVVGGAVEVEGNAQILGADGGSLGGDGPPTLATNWIDDERLSPWRLAEGRAPAPVTEGEVEVVIDRASASNGSLTVGSSTIIRTPEAVPVTVVGIATFGEQDSSGPSTHVLFDTTTAAQLLLGDSSRATALRLAAEPGTNHDDLATDIAAILPASTEALTGATLAAEQMADLESDFLGFFSALLLAFAAIGLLVATLTIHNTWSIIVAQRGQESALLRALGASRRQVVSTIAAESLLIGAAGTVVGLGAGLGLAAAAMAAMDSAGFGAPGGLTWSATSLVVAATVGITVTAAATVVPALAASRVAPLAAIREVNIDRSASSHLRLVAGAVMAVIAVGAALLSTSGRGSVMALAGAAVVAGVVALLLAAPVLAAPVAGTLGWPVARLRGRAGELARRNAVRNPRRTASTATSLTIGVGVVVLFLTVAASMTSYIDRTVAANFNGDLVIEADGFSGPGLSPSLAPAVAALDEVDLVASLATGVGRLDTGSSPDGGPARADGSAFDTTASTVYPTVTDPVALAAILDPEAVDGSFEAVGDLGLAVSQRFAVDHGLAAGDRVRLAIGQAEPIEVTVGAVFAQRDFVGDLIVDEGLWARHDGTVSTGAVLIRLAAGVDPASGHEAVAALAGDMAAPAPVDGETFVDRMAAQFDQVLAVVFALMALAMLIAVMGIGNTMSLSVHERTRELGLLRAVGMSRAGVRSTVRWESAIVACFGALSGVAVGLFSATVLLRAVEATEDIAVGLTVPFGNLILVVALAAASGIAAGFRPARRAARTDILEAIAAA